MGESGSVTADRSGSAASRGESVVFGGFAIAAEDGSASPGRGRRRPGLADGAERAIDAGVGVAASRKVGGAGSGSVRLAGASGATPSGGASLRNSMAGGGVD